jgi:hypothetical protein
MQIRLVLLPIILLVCGVLAAEDPHRNVPCKTSHNAGSCVWVHGRLRYGNGTPALRLWHIGTHHAFGVLSGASAADPLDNEHPELPRNVQAKLVPFETEVFGDFEVCPIEPEIPGAMQMACIESGKNLIAQ